MKREQASLQAYVNGCRSVSSPVRRLPTEILVAIFDLCSPEGVILSNLHALGFKESLDRQSKVHPHCGPLSEKLAAFLSLERSATFPLSVHIYATNIAAAPCLELLAQHSERWRSADIYVEPAVFSFLSRARGYLPFLERLVIGGEILDQLHIFEAAPKLTHIILWEFGQPLPKLPWSQLREITYALSERSSAIADGLAVLRLCSSQCNFHIHDLNLNFPLGTLPRISSDVRHLHLGIWNTKGPDHSRQAFGELLKALTLRSMHYFSCRTGHKYHPLVWPREQFSAFVSRSSCQNTLTTLNLHDMTITENDLVECLLDLPAIVELFIQDIPSSAPYATGHILITDSLLRRLSWTSGSACITPNLRLFVFASLLTFDDHVPLDFIVSRLRLVPKQSDGEAFYAGILWLPTIPIVRELVTEVFDHLVELENQGLAWSFNVLKGPK
ncbi:hypothetical protein DFH06DRAFT_1367410 [Mycena polygramma]|nr:hypothetical protein DFH06DRAFT_1367410 [Mycena polygramma]